jgi:hypothetical protein
VTNRNRVREFSGPGTRIFYYSAAAANDIVLVIRVAAPMIKALMNQKYQTQAKLFQSAVFVVIS